MSHLHPLSTEDCQYMADEINAAPQSSFKPVEFPTRCKICIAKQEEFCMHFIKNAPQWKATANQKKIEEPIAPIESESKSIEQGSVQSLGEKLRQRSERRRIDAISLDALPQIDCTERQRLIDELEGMITDKLLQSTDEWRKFEVVLFPIRTSNSQVTITATNVNEWTPFFKNLADRMEIRAHAGTYGVSFCWS